MSLPVILTAEAEDDLDEAIGWYERKQKGVGAKLLNCFKEELERITLFPESARSIFRDVRRVEIRRFPYGIFYQIETNCISVIAVYHNDRDPKGWQSRA